MDDSLEFLESTGQSAATVYAGERCCWRRSAPNRCTKKATKNYAGAPVCSRHYEQLLDSIGVPVSAEPVEEGTDE